MGLQIDEYTIQDDNGVLKIINETQHTDIFYSDPTLELKRNYQYNLYTREAFFFSRWCELYGNFTR